MVSSTDTDGGRSRRAGLLTLIARLLLLGMLVATLTLAVLALLDARDRTPTASGSAAIPAAGLGR